MESIEATACRECGHALIALYVGAKVHSVTVDPDRDDGPDRFGDHVLAHETLEGEQIEEIIAAWTGS